MFALEISGLPETGHQRQVLRIGGGRNLLYCLAVALGKSVQQPLNFVIVVYRGYAFVVVRAGRGLADARVTDVRTVTSGGRSRVRRRQG